MPKGHVVVSKVASAVENLDKVKVGDEVEINHYRVALKQAEKLDPWAPVAEQVNESAAATGTVGDMPAGVAGREVRATVEVLDVYPYKKADAFRGMDGK